MRRLASRLADSPEPRRLFATCSSNDINRIRRRSTQVTVAAGTIIHRHRDNANWLYIVLTGTAVAHDRGRNRTLTAGDVHGARALLAGDRSCGALIAQSEVRLLVLARTEFNALLNESAGFAHGIARHLAQTPNTHKRTGHAPSSAPTFQPKHAAPTQPGPKRRTP